ncbi:hypothetical protein GGU10DRAFT_337210 [Lentinula aff. detonsa]|uniref:Uncharacterized protein n=1 Tax=Lentinula aff. detonsa TaxID=2804958 RepID=A0AA38NB92_9AGAR|nr:hypothetical protein GGU10DRAFT_337210 [Lentinula aff. detonsa]
MDEERGLDGSTFESRYSEAPPDSDPKSSSCQARQQDQAERDATLQELASLQERLPAAVAIVNNSLGSSINKVEAQVRFVQAHENDTRTVQEELRESKLQVANLTGELSGVSLTSKNHDNGELEDHMRYGGHIKFP